MKRRYGLSWACGVLWLALAGCGGIKPENADDEEQLDPYRPVMATRINEVIYSKRPPGEMRAELAALGVATGMRFDDFKEESGIDDWFAGESDFLGTRHISLTCGLSPLVDAEGTITELHRNRKWFDGKLHEEMVIAAAMTSNSP
jgi:hypothetical protein